MTKAWRRSFSVSLLFVLSACAACGPAGGRIRLEPCGEGPTCTLEFGLVDMAVRSTQTVRVSNVGDAPLAVSDFQIDDPSGSFDVDPAAVTLQPGSTLDVVVAVRVSGPAPVEGTLLVESDATNPTDGVMTLRASGVDHGIPKIEATPLECTFDGVAAHSIATCEIVLGNSGNRSLEVDRIAFAPYAGSSGDLFAIPAESKLAFGDACNETGGSACPFSFAAGCQAAAIAVNTSLSCEIAFAPDAVGEYRGVLRIESGDPKLPTLDIPLDALVAE